MLKVLVYDDQAAVVDALAVLFEIHGIPMVAASARSEVLGRIARGDIGVVIQDMNFSPNLTSGEEGIDLFRSIREADAGMPVLLITAWASVETAVRLIKEGATDYLAKPWDDDRLVTTVKNLLTMRRLQLDNDRLQRSREAARRSLSDRYDLAGLIYESDTMHEVISVALNVADSDAPVLVTGPSGSGKEKIAEVIQANSRRSAGPFIKVNLGAIPEDLMESELFGAEPGAYTGSKKLRVGRFEAAGGGTLFLDEIDSLSLAGQVKLLRVLQSGEYQRLGSSATRRSDTRIISATNSDLDEAIRAGRFREDLFFRLNVIELSVPPLASRPDDILPLARHFLKRLAGDDGPAALGPDAETALLGYSWPGNVRELENRLRRATLVRRGGRIERQDLDLHEGAGRDGEGQAPVAGPGLAERRRIEEALERADGVVARAAEVMGLSRQALYRKMSRLGIVLERRPKT